MAAVNQNSITIYNVFTFEAVASLRCGLRPVALAMTCSSRQPG